MAKVVVKPYISGGRTLSRMYHQKKAGGPGSKRNKKATWRQLDDVKYTMDDIGPSLHRILRFE